MTAARGGIISSTELLSVNFNQDSTCISTGTRTGYSISNCDPFGQVYAKNDGATSIVEMLFCTSLVALVGAGDRPGSSTRRLQIINTKRQSTICELTFPTTILSVRLNRRRLVVVLEERIYVYDISNMKLLHEIETSPNPNAISALSPSSENSYLAYPSPLPSPATPFCTTPPSSSSSSSSYAYGHGTGDVLLFDAVSLSVTNIIQAHKAPLSVVSLNPTGTMLATASEKGTVIRVFSLPNGAKLHEFRRGSYPARIYSISFNATSTLLCVSSDTETVHIFKLAKSTSSSKNRARSMATADFDEDTVLRYNNHRSSSSFDAASIDSSSSYLQSSSSSSSHSALKSSLRKRSINLGRNLAGSVGGFLPDAVTGLWDPQRDFAFLKLPTAGVRSVVAMNSTTPSVMVITSEGIFYSYAIDLESGGECLLMQSYSLLEGNGSNADDTNSSSSMGD